MVEILRLQAKRGFVMPAHASIFGFVGRPKKTWIPAYAGMTKRRVDFESTNLEPLGLEPGVIQWGEEHHVNSSCRRRPASIFGYA